MAPQVEAHFASDSTEEAFRESVRRAARAGDAVVIGAYSRKEFYQTGDGHYSPIGGYHAASDSVLILDVARFKYPPHWVSLAAMWKVCPRSGARGREASEGGGVPCPPTPPPLPPARPAYPQPLSP